MHRVDIPVLIVGGGGAGLTASMLLSQLGVDSLVVSALPTTSVLPKAHILNQRTMEIFTDPTAIVADDTPEPTPLDAIRLYVPSTRPGAPLPHAEVEDPDGRRHALMGLVRPGHFLLIAGEDGAAWCAAAARLAEASGLPLHAVRIGHLDGDYRDPRCTWLRQRQITTQGAILVRPDRFVTWRSAGAVADPAGELRAALSRGLCRAFD